MAGVIGSPTVTGRLSAAADKAGDGARTQVAQFGESAQQIVLLLLQLRQGRWHGGTPSLNVLYMFRPQLQKRKHPPLHFHVAHPSESAKPDRCRDPSIPAALPLKSATTYGSTA